MFILLWFDLQITFSANGSLTTFGDIVFGIVHEAYRAFTIGFGNAGVRAFEAGSEFSVTDEAADGFCFPFACGVQPNDMRSKGRLSFE